MTPSPPLLGSDVDPVVLQTQLGQALETQGQLGIRPSSCLSLVGSEATRLGPREEETSLSLKEQDESDF